MPHIDQIVLGLMLAGLVASIVDHWRGGQRGWRLATVTFISFFGIGLVTMMAGHCADIIYNVVLANRSVIDGSPFTYNWRTYSLLLFGVLLIGCGVRCLGAVRRFARHDDAARQDVLRNAGVVLAITLPTIPIHAFFGGLMSGWSLLALIVASVGLRGTPHPAGREPAISLGMSPASRG